MSGTFRTAKAGNGRAPLHFGERQFHVRAVISSSLAPTL